MRKRKRKQQKKNKRKEIIWYSVFLIVILTGIFIISERDDSLVLTETKRNQIINSNEWKEIFEHSEDYPPVLLEDLKRNPELLDFVKKYPVEQTAQEAGLTFREKLKKYPLFIQWDERWGYQPYGQSNIGISGCGPTCMAMVIYSLTRNSDALPDMLAQEAMTGGYYIMGTGTAWSFMNECASAYGVIASQFASLEQWELEDRLEDGNMIICAMGPGDFSAQGHFIVIYDYTSDGFCVNDPFSYTNSSKKWDYATLSSQWQQIWVYAA